MNQTFKNIIGTVAAKLSKTAAEQINRVLARAVERSPENSASETTSSSSAGETKATTTHGTHANNAGNNKTPPKQAPTAALQKTTVNPNKTSPTKSGPPPVSSEERRKMIAEAAYYIAEKQGCQNGASEENWLQAESQIDTMLAETQKQPQENPNQSKDI